MLTPVKNLSNEYHQVEALLDGGCSGEYGDLAVAFGRTRKSGRTAGRLVKSYAYRHPSWDHSNVYTKKTGRPAYEN